MPLRDHFRPPLDDYMSWEGFHAQWPAVIVGQLAKTLPARYVAFPRVHTGRYAEIDIGSFEMQANEQRPIPAETNGGVATALWAPPTPTLSVAVDWPDSEYQIRVYDTTQGRRLVAAIEVVSPANKDRPEHRRLFVAKCAALLQQHVSVIIIDVVSTRHANLYRELLNMVEQHDAAQSADTEPLYAVACRWRAQEKTHVLETWHYPMLLGQPLPTVPLWLATDLAQALDLEQSYEQTCADLRIR